MDGRVRVRIRDGKAWPTGESGGQSALETDCVVAAPGPKVAKRAG